MDQQQPNPRPRNLTRTFALFGALVLIALAWKFIAPVTISKNANENINATLNTNAAVVPTVSYPGVDGKNALDLLKESHTVVEDGGFVKSIDGRENTGSTYWFLYVNGKSSEVGAKDVQTKPSDTLEWRFEEYKPS